MSYLKSFLNGEAANLIQHLQVTKDNFEAAWTILKTRYDNKRLQVSTILEKLIQQPNCVTDSANSLKMLHDTSNECMHALKVIGINTDEWNPILHHLLIKKLDAKTHTAYEQQLANPRELQSMADLLKFLDVRFQAHEVIGKQTNEGKIQSRPNSTVRKERNTMVVVAPNEGKCEYCNGVNHPLYNCEKFKGLSVEEKRKSVIDLGACFNCLRKGHSSFRCRSNGCSRCRRKHHTLLHQDWTKQPTESTSSTVNDNNQEEFVLPCVLP